MRHEIVRCETMRCETRNLKFEIGKNNKDSTSYFLISSFHPETWKKVAVTGAVYSKKLNKIPAATADPITPETFGAMACISK